MKLWSAILIMMASASLAYGAVSHAEFGKLPDGSPVTIYTLKSPHVELRVMTFGARVVSIKTPDRLGKMANVVLGYDDLKSYIHDSKTYFGVVPGRYANRIANATYLTVVTMIKVQMRSESVPSATARSGLPPVRTRTVLSV